MKYLLATILLILALNISGLAQSDTLVINLKSNQSDKIAISQIQRVEFEDITFVETINSLSNGLSVKGNNPNPVVEQTEIEFEIASNGMVRIIIYDNSGNQIKTLKCNDCKTGKNYLLWNCQDMSNNRVRSGVYFYEVQFDNQVQSKKMIIIK